MISLTKYLFYIFLISYYFDLKTNVATAKKTDKSQQVETTYGTEEEITEATVLKKNISEAKQEATFTSKHMTKISTTVPLIDADGNKVQSTSTFDADTGHVDIDLAEESTGILLILPNSNTTTLMMTFVGTPESTTNTIHGTTKQPESSKSSLPLILGSIFGSLAVVVLITSIITYVLVRRGYIKIFKQSRPQMNNTEHRRMINSSSTTGAASPSQR